MLRWTICACRQSKTGVPITKGQLLLFTGNLLATHFYLWDKRSRFYSIGLAWRLLDPFVIISDRLFDLLFLLVNTHVYLLGLCRYLTITQLGATIRLRDSLKPFHLFDWLGIYPFCEILVHLRWCICWLLQKTFWCFLRWVGIWMTLLCGSIYLLWFFCTWRVPIIYPFSLVNRALARVLLQKGLQTHLFFTNTREKWLIFDRLRDHHASRAVAFVTPWEAYFLITSNLIILVELLIDCACLSNLVYPHVLIEWGHLFWIQLSVSREE